MITKIGRLYATKRSAIKRSWDAERELQDLLPGWETPWVEATKVVETGTTWSEDDEDDWTDEVA